MSDVIWKLRTLQKNTLAKTQYSQYIVAQSVNEYRSVIEWVYKRLTQLHAHALFNMQLDDLYILQKEYSISTLNKQAFLYVVYVYLHFDKSEICR